MADRQTDNKIHGKLIICTYPQPEPDEFSVQLEKAGAKVLFMPAIEIRPLTCQLPKQLSDYNWLVFTSKNGISSFFNQYQPAANNKVAVLGEATGSELNNFSLNANYTGTGRTGADFAKELKDVIHPGESVLLVLGELAPDTIQQELQATNSVDRINIYQTVAPDHFDPECVELIESESYDLMIISSPSAIKNLYLAFREKISQWRVISIGKTTTAACRNLGIEPLTTAKDSSYKGLAETTIEYLQHQNI
ncbi:uroporphyrinogen-III synthase [Mangrovibacterium diazotrophicum]|uniref:Uroporphyrinogen-III synthase n=1 Tax=Mangrovibacterium diazotrophicum TaxID=1261403 RepID=A0A419VYC1_9BACT|nr:uroporphyrinogen-III synthase [Mangrovibacterium diazotrophicum]RKD88206.1 uroporphyrinogen-III synthase [Mangrovibacterium diazotrophicum]